MNLMISLLGWTYNGGVLGKYMIIFGFRRYFAGNVRICDGYGEFQPAKAGEFSNGSFQPGRFATAFFLSIIVDILQMTA
jgi:hypothetical protein